MIPIKNKKKTLKITVEEMRNFSLSYVKQKYPILIRKILLI